MTKNTSEFQLIIEKLTPETQSYLLDLARVASRAEESVKEQLKKKKTTKKAG